MAKERKIAIYPGSFDPITNGHIDIIKRASDLFDELIVAISNDSSKETLFTIKEREQMMSESLSGIKNIKIVSFEGLLVDFALNRNVKIIVRGLRALSDFEYEFRMAIMNRNLNNDIETTFLMTHEKYAHISSSSIKEIHFLGGCVNKFVPKPVLLALNKIKDE